MKNRKNIIYKSDLKNDFDKYMNERNYDVEEVYIYIKKHYTSGNELSFEYIKFEKLRIKKELNLYESDISKIYKNIVVGLALALTPIYIQSICELIEFKGIWLYFDVLAILVIYLVTFSYLCWSFNKDRRVEDTKALMLNIALEVLTEIELDLEKFIKVEVDSDKNQCKSDKVNANKK